MKTVLNSMDIEDGTPTGEWRDGYQVYRLLKTVTKSTASAFDATYTVTGIKDAWIDLSDSYFDIGLGQRLPLAYANTGSYYIGGYLVIGTNSLRVMCLSYYSGTIHFVIKYTK